MTEKGYIKNIQHFYNQEPLFQASLQILLSVFTVAFFIFMAIRPTLKTVSTLLKTIDDQKKVDQQLDTKIAQLAQAQDNLAAYGVEVEQLLKRAVPESPEVGRLARQIEALSVESGAYLISLTVDKSTLVGEVEETRTTDRKEVEEKKGVGKPAFGRGRFVTFGFSVGGATAQIRQFVEGLEKMERAVLLAKLTIGDTEIEQQRGSFPLTAIGKVTAYYLPTELVIGEE